MENFDYQKYREELAEDLKRIKDKEDRHGWSETVRNLPDYKKAKGLHKQDMKLPQAERPKVKRYVENKESAGERKARLEKLYSVKSRFDTNSFTHLFEDTVNLADAKEFKHEHKREIVEALKDNLKDIPLVDLGCGHEDSVRMMYKLARAYDVKEYTAVDANPPESYFKEYEKVFEEVQQSDESKKDVPGKFVKEDMLHFLIDRDEKSNFVMNGIDQTIIDKFDDMEYLDGLFSEISRLTPKDGIIFGIGSSFMDFYLKDSKYGFKNIIPEEESVISIWQKIKEEE